MCYCGRYGSIYCHKDAWPDEASVLFPVAMLSAISRLGKLAGPQVYTLAQACRMQLLVGPAMRA